MSSRNNRPTVWRGMDARLVNLLCGILGWQAVTHRLALVFESDHSFDIIALTGAIITLLGFRYGSQDTPNTDH